RRTAQDPLLLANAGNDGLVVELRVVETDQEMDRAGPRGGDAAADLVRELRVPAGHERGRLLVAHLDELGVAVGAVERAEKAVDAVTRIPVDAVNPPLREAFEHKVRDDLGHPDSSSVGTNRKAMCPVFGSANRAPDHE